MYVREVRGDPNDSYLDPLLLEAQEVRSRLLRSAAGTTGDFGETCDCDLGVGIQPLTTNLRCVSIQLELEDDTSRLRRDHAADGFHQ
jgi:hypothetical protein